VKAAMEKAVQFVITKVSAIAQHVEVMEKFLVSVNMDQVMELAN
jgi:hypothetical protein